MILGCKNLSSFILAVISACIMRRISYMRKSWIASMYCIWLICSCTHAHCCPHPHMVQRGRMVNILPIRCPLMLQLYFSNHEVLFNKETNLILRLWNFNVPISLFEGLFKRMIILYKTGYGHPVGHNYKKVISLFRFS